MFRFENQSQTEPDASITINDHQYKCNKAATMRQSQIFKDYFLNRNNENIQIPEFLEEPDSNFELITSLLKGEEIKINRYNYQMMSIFANHFKIDELIKKLEDYKKFEEDFYDYVKKSEEIKELKSLEKALLKMEEKNMEETIKKCESLLSMISSDSFVTAVMNICILSNIKNEYQKIVNFLKELNKIKAGILDLFMKVVIRRFIEDSRERSSEKSREINLFVHQLFEEKYLNEEKVDYYLKKESNYSFRYPSIFIDFIDINKIELPGEIEEEDKNEEYKIHKMKCEKCFNGDALLKSIREDNIDIFQKNVAISNVNVNIRIKSSVYERNSMINDGDCTLIEYSAFFGSIKCFKYLLTNQVNIEEEKLMKYAIAGGNFEIIHLCEQSKCSFKGALLASIQFHRHEITRWLIENNYDRTKDNERIIIDESILHYDFNALEFLLVKGFNIEEILISSCKSNNELLAKWSIELIKNEEYQQFKGIKNEDEDEFIRKTALHIACEKENIELVRLLLSFDGIDINSIYKDIKKEEDIIITKKALHIACEKENIELVRLLLSFDGIDIDIQDDQKRKPFQILRNQGIKKIFH